MGRGRDATVKGRRRRWRRAGRLSACCWCWPLKGLRPISQDLRVAVVYDTEHAMAQITGQTMQQWGVSEEQVHQKAIDNLHHKAPPKFVSLAPGLFGSDYGDYYDAARILLPELAYQLPLPGTCQAVART